jgi:hypothetical protein
MTGPLQSVARECRRIAVEAKARGLEHFAAIALHNLGMLLRQIGDLEGSIRRPRTGGTVLVRPPCKSVR